MSNYIKPNTLFRGWIDNKDNIIEIPRGREHHEKEYIGNETTDHKIKIENWIRFYSDKIDVVFEVKNLDNHTFKRIYNFFIKNLKGDLREIFIQDATTNKYKSYKPMFKETFLKRYKSIYRK